MQSLHRYRYIRPIVVVKWIRAQAHSSIYRFVDVRVPVQIKCIRYIDTVTNSRSKKSSTSASLSLRLLMAWVPPNEKNRRIIRYLIDYSDRFSSSKGFLLLSHRLRAVPIPVYEWDAYLRDSVKRTWYACSQDLQQNCSFHIKIIFMPFYRKSHIQWTESQSKLSFFHKSIKFSIAVADIHSVATREEGCWKICSYINYSSN